MEIPWGWSVTGYALTDKDPEAICSLCNRIGYHGIEGAPPQFEHYSMQELSDIGDGFRQAGLVLDTLHLPFAADDDIASFYETTRKNAVRHIRTWLEKAAALGVRVCIQHPTTTSFSTDVEGLTPYMQRLGQSLRELLPACQELGLMLAIENMLPGNDGHRFASHPEHFRQFSQEFGHPSLGYCLDTGHAFISMREEAASFFAAMSPRLCAVHLQDTSGSRDMHIAPGRGRINWKQVFSGMADSGYRGVACIECEPFGFGPDYADADWTSLLEDTQVLARHALRSE